MFSFSYQETIVTVHVGTNHTSIPSSIMKLNVQHSGIVISTVVLQQEGAGFKHKVGSGVFAVCMFYLCCLYSSCLLMPRGCSPV